MSERIKIIEAVARLTAFREHLANERQVSERIVQELHDILRLLEEATNVDLSRFKLGEDDVQPRLLMASSAGSVHSTVKYCDRSLVMMKAQGAENMANMLLADEEKKIGFKA